MLKLGYVTGEEVFVADDAMRMKEDNQLAGATTFLNKCLHNLMRFAGLSWTEAVQVGCLNPARLAGVADRKRDIQVGMDADLLVGPRTSAAWLNVTDPTIVYGSGRN